MPTVQSDKASMYYEVHGEGAAVVFAHGRGGNAAIWWQQTAHFSDGFKVIVFDHRTFGRSMGGADGFSQSQMVADLMAILDAEGIDRAALVCQSMGGWTGLGAAVHYPERVSCLVLTGTPGGLITPAMHELLAAWERSPERISEFPGRVLAPDFPAREPAKTLLYAQISAFNVGVDPEALMVLRDPAHALAPSQFRDYRIPTLFILGEHDQLFPPTVLRLAAAEVPGAEVEEMAGAGHSPYWEYPDHYNAIVQRFLDKHLSN